MENQEILNGISAIQTALAAYTELRDSVTDPKGLEEKLLWLLDGLCAENPALTAGHAIQNENACQPSPLGICTAALPAEEGVRTLLAGRLPRLVSGERFVLPVEADFSRGLTMALEVDGGPDSAAGASVMAQYTLLSMLRKNRGLNFRCGDMVMGGSFFSSVHSIIASFPKRTGGQVYTKPEDIETLTGELEQAAAAAISALGGAYDCVFDYNQNNAAKIQEYAAVIYLDKSSRSGDLLRRLRLLMSNRRKNGISLILVGSGELLGPMEDLTDFYLRYSGGQVRAGGLADLPFVPGESVSLPSGGAALLLEEMKAAAVVDTRFEHYPELNGELFTMDSTDMLRIPFGVDANGVVQYFELGNEAPHALISGAAGSGKSVALHALIMQTVRNYHPDDVEIWAIDYKAVEFDGYIQHRTPHFRVIGCDTSPEFSLSLLDLLEQEYQRRTQLFLSVGAKNIKEYRQRMGPRSLPRIVVFIDEFQAMTQAVQQYTGAKDYRTLLENQLRLFRSAGMIFVFCSQTISSGLSGLTEAGREQIGARLCLKHNEDNEIRETLLLSGEGVSEVVSRAKEMRTGQYIYRRPRRQGEHAPDGKGYEYKDGHILFISNEKKAETIDAVNAKAAGTYTPKDEIIVRGGGRIPVSEKVRHPLQRFLDGNYEPEEDALEWYPAAPTTLADAFRLDLERIAGANILLVGEDSGLRESIVVHSLCGFLMDPHTRIVASFVDETYPQRARMIQALSAVRSDRLTVNAGVQDTLDTIARLKKIRPVAGQNTIYLWYGLDKLKNEIFLMNQEDEEEPQPAPAAPSEKEMSIDDQIADFMAMMSGLMSDTSASAAAVQAKLGKDLSFEDCRTILRTAFENGPENGLYHMALFNNYKMMKKSGLIDLASFENRLGSRMSADDSYELFGSSLAIGKTDENTVIYYSGSGQPTPLRPYLMPDAAWFTRFNAALNRL